MGRKYSVVFAAVAVTAAQDFFQIKGAADKVTKLLGFELAQASDAGDAQEEFLQLYVKRGTGAVTDGSGGSTPTPQPVIVADSAYGGVTEANNTTALAVGSGTLATLWRGAMNERVPYEKWFPPGLEPQINGATWLAIGTDSTPADSITMSATAWFEEE